MKLYIKRADGQMVGMVKRGAFVLVCLTGATVADIVRQFREFAEGVSA